MTGSSTVPVIWSNAEISVGIICACLPTLGPLMQATSEKLVAKPKQVNAEEAHWSSHSSKIDEVHEIHWDTMAPEIDPKACTHWEKALPSLPTAAHWEVDTIRAGSFGTNSENVGVNAPRVSTGRAKHKYHGDESV